MLADEKATTVAFLRRAIVFYRRHAIQVEQLMTHNGSAYHAPAPIAPRPTARRALHPNQLSGWAYGAIYRESNERTNALDGWPGPYNHQRRHPALGHKPPIARLTERTNLLGSYS